jgi:hypothetical protein
MAPDSLRFIVCGVVILDPGEDPPGAGGAVASGGASFPSPQEASEASTPADTKQMNDKRERVDLISAPLR